MFLHLYSLWNRKIQPYTLWIQVLVFDRFEIIYLLTHHKTHQNCGQLLFGQDKPFIQRVRCENVQLNACFCFMSDVLIWHVASVLWCFCVRFHFIGLVLFCSSHVHVAAKSIICFAVFRDTPRKRGGATSGSSGPGRCAITASSFSAEPQPEEAVDGNFPVSRSEFAVLVSLTQRHFE